MGIKKRILTVILLVLLFIQFVPGDDLSKEKILQFADFLYKAHDFSRAAYEYLRVLHLFENSQEEMDQLNLKVGNCFSLLNQTDNAKKYYDFCFQSKTNETIYQRALVQLGFLLFREGKHGESISVLNEKQLSASSELINSIILANYLCLGNADRAKRMFNVFKEKGKTYIGLLDQYLELLSSLKTKSPLKAGIMSALFPGTGRIYAGRVKEGLISMISFFATSYLAYEGFRDSGIGSFKGWLFSSIGAFLYIGNIYGSVIAAQVTNSQIQNGFKQGIEISFKLYIHD